MSTIFKDFAKAFAPLNFETTGEDCVSVPGGRAYLREQFDQIKPYIDQIHWKPCTEDFYVQQSIRDDLAKKRSFHGRVYAGCAGVVNLDFMAATKAPAAILFDINPLQKIMWDSTLDLLAALPDRDDFLAHFPNSIKSLYYMIETMYGEDAIQMYMSSPEPEPNLHYRRSRSSPLRGMDYEWVERWNRNFTRDDKSWIATPENYRHLHLMAKHRAIATLTLDVRDTEACARVGETLASQNISVGLLYRSNVGHYLRCTTQEIKKLKANGEQSQDYSGRPTTTHTYREANDNLRRWMDPKRAYMIASDKQAGLMGVFVPRMTKIQGLAPQV